MIWVCSDLHFNHYNILNLEKFNLSRSGLDYINTLDQYNKMIVSHINQKVGKQDTLYILGDFGFGPVCNLKPLLDSIHCQNKILIFGNHDSFSVTQAKNMGFSQALPEPYYLPEAKGRIILSHHPAYDAYENPYIAYNIHGHLHGSKIDNPHFFNANIAMCDYFPVKLDSFLGKCASLAKSRDEKWLQEWYKFDQIFIDRKREDLNLDHLGKIIREENKDVNKND